MASPTPSPGLSTAWCGDRFRRLANPFESLAKRKGPPQRRWSFSMPATAGSAGSRRRVDARFTLAAWTLAFGPLAVWTLVPSDTCHHRLWSLSALVTAARDGARTTQSTERTNSRVNSRFLHDMRWLPECAPHVRRRHGASEHQHCRARSREPSCRRERSAGLQVSTRRTRAHRLLHRAGSVLSGTIRSCRCKSARSVRRRMVSGNCWNGSCKRQAAPSEITRQRLAIRTCRNDGATSRTM
jgi:hypothetical protein